MALEIEGEGIFITNKTLKGQLIELCIKSYLQDNMFKRIDTQKIKHELYCKIGQNIVHEFLDVKVNFIDSGNLYIKILLDKLCIDCNILHTGRAVIDEFNHGDGPITRITE